MKTKLRPVAPIAAGTIAAGLTLSGCGSAAGRADGSRPPRPTSRPSGSVSSSCPVTHPRGQTPPERALRDMSGQVIASRDEPDWLGSGGLWTRLTLLRPTRRDGQTGMITLKHLWFRARPGDVHVTAHPATGGDAAFSASVGTSQEYGAIGFVASVLSFARPGCWTITASLQDDPLSFTTRVPAPTAP
jgi:hypothetical protein